MLRVVCRTNDSLLISTLKNSISLLFKISDLSGTVNHSILITFLFVFYKSTDFFHYFQSPLVENNTRFHSFSIILMCVLYLLLNRLKILLLILVTFLFFFFFTNLLIFFRYFQSRLVENNTHFHSSSTILTRVLYVLLWNILIILFLDRCCAGLGLGLGARLGESVRFTVDEPYTEFRS